MSGQLLGKVALVTGSSAGIGRAIALKLASQGAKVTICGRDPKKIEAVVAQAGQVSGGHKDRFLGLRGDLTQQSTREELVAKTVGTFGQLDILVPNAGTVEKTTSVWEADEATYDKIMNTNLKSVFFLLQQALPHLEQTKGCVVNISAISSMLPFVNSPIYPMSKAALDHMTRSLACDLGPKGIRVNSVNPGYIKTDILRCYGPDEAHVIQTLTKFEQPKQAISHRLGTPEDIAETVAFLASDAASFITGEIIKVDGGRTVNGGAFDFK